MPTVRLPEDSGPGNYRHRDGFAVQQGETVNVAVARAEYLVEEWGFDRVDGDGGLNQQSGDDGGDVLVNDSEGDAEICGVEMADGDTCDRPATECPYHGDELEE
jgi:hypothetical protein